MLGFINSPCKVKCTDKVVDNGNFSRLGFPVCMGNFDAVYKLSQKRCVKFPHIRVLLHRCDKRLDIGFLLFLLFQFLASNLCHRFKVALFQLVVAGHLHKTFIR